MAGPGHKKDQASDTAEGSTGENYDRWLAKHKARNPARKTGKTATRKGRSTTK
jgi:hypothetical protein